MPAVVSTSSSDLKPQPMLPEPGPSSVLGSSVAIKGTIVSQDDIYFDGVVEGSIEAVSATVTVGPNARLAASILARTVILLGSVEGPVTALQNIDLRKGCKLIGNVTTSRIAIEDGAYLKGSIDIGGQLKRPLPASEITVLEQRYASLVDLKHLRGLTKSEDAEFESLSSKLAS